MEIGGAAAGRDWSALPVDLMLIAMASMEVPDVVNSGAVCSSWRSAYVAFRALCLPTPPRPPCLLYHASDDGPGAATLYSPYTNTTFRVPLQEPHGVIATAHGWLFATDEAANPYLLNPLTGARAALPAITTLERAKSSFVDDSGSVVYNVDYQWRSKMDQPDMQKVTAQRARDWIYRRVAISASPLAVGACVVLLVHMPYEELSFARPGDDRWTSLCNLEPLHRGSYISAAYSNRDGLFYVLQNGGSVHALDLNGPSSPAAWPFAYTLQNYSKCNAYLVPTPCGDLLLLTRRRCRSAETLERRSNGDEVHMKHKFTTTDVRLEKIDFDRFRMERLTGGHADYLGPNSALCLPIKELPASMSNRNCAYLTDDGGSDKLHSAVMRQDVGLWDFATGSMQKLGDVWPLHPWHDSLAPIWFTPSLC